MEKQQNNVINIKKANFVTQEELEELDRYYEEEVAPELEKSFDWSTPKPDEINDIETARIFKALEEADGNASGLERQLNEKEYYKALRGEPCDMERAEKFHNLSCLIWEEAKKLFKQYPPKEMK